jgi:hypothetical protein
MSQIKTLEIRFAGGAYFPLNKAGNGLKSGVVLTPNGGRHKPMLYVPLSDAVLCDPAWGTECCVVLDGAGSEYVAIDLSGAETLSATGFDENAEPKPCRVDLPHVLDLTGPLNGYQPTHALKVSVPCGDLSELRLAPDWASGPNGGLPAQRVCTEAVWRAGRLAKSGDRFRLAVLKGNQTYNVTLPDLDVCVVMLNALCGWTGKTEANPGAIDFDGARDIFGSKPALPGNIKYRAATKQPRVGGCPPIKALR